MELSLSIFLLPKPCFLVVSGHTFVKLVKGASHYGMAGKSRGNSRKPGDRIVATSNRSAAPRLIRTAVLRNGDTHPFEDKIPARPKLADLSLALPAKLITTPFATPALNRSAMYPKQPEGQLFFSRCAISETTLRYSLSECKLSIAVRNAASTCGSLE
jgi:hypothetical protein